MTKEYQVTVCRFASSVATVEASSLEEACDLAYQECSSSLCHQCSGEVELGDIDGFVVYVDGEQVRDDTQATELREQRDRLRREIEALRDEARENAALMRQHPTAHRPDVVEEVEAFACRLDAILEAAAPTQATSESADGGES